jgi:hypothetical protein
VTNPPDGRVDILDRASRAVAKPLRVALRPRNVAFDCSGHTAIISDEGGAVHFVR